VTLAHPHLPHLSVAAVLRRRWPNADPTQGPMSLPIGVGLGPETAAAIGILRRGIEPLRIVVPPQCARHRSTASGAPEPEREPMPISLG
jgi:hypothetical protein